jgi:hypothetical protein
MYILLGWDHTYNIFFYRLSYTYFFDHLMLYFIDRVAVTLWPYSTICCLFNLLSHDHPKGILLHFVITTSHKKILLFAASLIWEITSFNDSHSHINLPISSFIDYLIYVLLIRN